MNEIKPGFDGMPPVKEQYEPEEKKLIAAKATEAGVKVIAEVYGLKWQTVSSWRRLLNQKKSAPKRKTASRTKKNAEIIIQSPDGQEITTNEILERVGQADKIYVRVDENKAYWVRVNEAGSVDLW